MEKFVPVVVIKELEETERILTALRNNGINCAEITFRTACAAEAIKYAREKYPTMNVGAGTVINAEQCKTALLKKSKNVLDANFIEGMACVGGCIGGAGCLTHGEKNKAQVDEYGKEAFEKTILDAVSLLK